MKKEGDVPNQYLRRVLGTTWAPGHWKGPGKWWHDLECGHSELNAHRFHPGMLMHCGMCQFQAEKEAAEEGAPANG